MTATPKPMRMVPEGSPVLRMVAEPIEPGEEIDWLGRRLAATAERQRGGLAVAAPQVGRSLRLVGTIDGRRVGNPVIVERSGSQVGIEGCLSFPGRNFLVERAKTVTVEGIHPLTGTRMHATVEDLMARLWQHEIDHLDGLLLVGRFEEVTE